MIYSICEDFQLDFYAMYGCVGLWSSFFLVLYSLFDVSRLMRWSTRSTEEIFALFISIAFCVDAFRDTVKSKRPRSLSLSRSLAVSLLIPVAELSKKVIEFARDGKLLLYEHVNIEYVRQMEIPPVNKSTGPLLGRGKETMRTATAAPHPVN